jgi:hypothetical protein
MHPGFWGYWHAHRQGGGHGSEGRSSEGHGAGACAPGCGGAMDGRRERRQRAATEWHTMAHGGEDGTGFGVRRPLRFLAQRLELSEGQVTELATVLSALKTERAQAEVDQRRRTTALAAAFEVPEFDGGKVDTADAEQARSAERLRQSVKQALGQIHALLDEAQRKKFAYLLRTGVLSI